MDITTLAAWGEFLGGPASLGPGTFPRGETRAVLEGSNVDESCAIVRSSITYPEVADHAKPHPRSRGNPRGLSLRKPRIVPDRPRVGHPATGWTS